MTTERTNGKLKDLDFGPNVHISSHPVLSHKVTILRSSATTSHTFRAVLREVTYHLGYEATSRLTTQPVAITVPVPPKEKGGKEEHVEYHGSKLVEHVALIPILRSGLGMVDSMLELLPNAAIHHIGMYKVLGQNPVQYFNRLPRTCHADVAYILDPVIATSSTVMSLISILKKWGVPQINIISVMASRAGLQQLMDAHPDIYVSVGTVEEEISEEGIILPGLGDAGDRQFGTATVTVDDESLLHISKRKRTMSAQLD